MKQYQRTLLHLSLIDAGPAAVTRLVSSLGHNLPNLYQMSVGDIIAYNVPAKTAQKIVEGLTNTIELDNELTLIDKYAISYVTFLDDEYPYLLKNITGPPLFLYLKGTLPTHDNALAIVGSRLAHGYAQTVINQIVPVMVGNGWSIISGGALGADAMAHQATLNAGGKTVAILGSGLLKPYPSRNKNLFEEIIAKGGGLVSAFSLLTDPDPNNFPARNRIISGLSRGCLIVQAAQKSGARITADFCLSQGREVFAVPGDVNDVLSVGCHELIQQGAKLTTSAVDILAEFGQEIVPVQVQKELFDQSPVAPISSGISEHAAVDGRIINFCANPCSIDELLDHTEMPLIQMSARLFDLQVRGLICQTMGGLWQKR